MKRVLLVFLACLPVALSAHNSFQSFYDKYEGKEGFTSVKISPKMFNLIASAETDDEDIQFLQSITGLRMLALENEDHDPAIVERSKQLYKEAQALIGSGYDELMSVKESGTDLKILARSAEEGVISDLLIVGNDDGEFIYVDITGKIDLKKIGSLSDSIDINGMDHLKDLEDTDKK